MAGGGLRRGSIAWALAGAAFALSSWPVAPARGDQGWWGDLDKGQSVRLADVLAAPDTYRGRTITFTCVFHQREKEFNPLRTRFNAERYDNVSVWPDGKLLWLNQDFTQDYPFLYVQRVHAQQHDLVSTPTYTRIEVTGRIEVVLDGWPFIEMTSFKPTGHRLGREVVEAMVRAETYWKSSDPSARSIAVDNARAALHDVPDLAPVYAARIRARLVEWLKALGREEEARAAERTDGSPAPDVPGAPGAPAPAAPLRPVDDLPGVPVEPSPSLPAPGTDLPGVPVEPAAPAPAAPDPTPRLPAAPRVEVPAPPAPPPVDPRSVVPGGLPGIPVDEPAAQPQPRVPALPAVEPRAPQPLPPTPVAGAPVVPPEVVDPPLPPPDRNGAPPVRRPRLAGVK